MGGLDGSCALLWTATVGCTRTPPRMGRCSGRLSRCSTVDQRESAVLLCLAADTVRTELITLYSFL
eukprot:3297766-Amphidinium_carterae.1